MPSTPAPWDMFGVAEQASGLLLPPSFEIVVPIAEDRENLVINPSFENDSIGWVDDNASSTPVSGNSWVGVGSLQVVPTIAGGGVYYEGAGSLLLGLTSGSVYAMSMMFRGLQGNIPYDFYIATTAGVRLVGCTFKSTGFWQRITFLHRSTATANRRLYVASTNNAGANKTFYVDAVQVELCSANKYYSTTFIDGDQKGFGTLQQYSLDYYWKGTPHASTSVRTKYTRAGGRLVNLTDLGLNISEVSGLGLAQPRIVSSPFSQLDGESFLRVQKESRMIAITGRVNGRSPSSFGQRLSDLLKELDKDSHVRDEPIILQYTPRDEFGEQMGTAVTLQVAYAGGAGGVKTNQTSETYTLNFRQSIPFALGHQESASLTVSASISNADGILRRLTTGAWAACSTGIDSAASEVRCIAIHPNGTVYVGGTFTNIGGSGADYAAIYNPLTNAFSVIGSATTFSASVESIFIDSNGDVYFGGAFSNAAGIANADFIVKYVPTTGVFSALGTGTNDIVYTITRLGANLYVGGQFTLAGGIANTIRIARWTGSAWQAMGTGALNNNVSVLAGRGNRLYAAGLYTQIGGVANTNGLAYWNTSTNTWNSLGVGTDTDGVLNMKFGQDGNLYLVGGFGSLGGTDMVMVGRWNGITFQPVGSPTAFNGLNLYAIDIAPNGDIWVGGFRGLTLNGVAVPDSFAVWNGGTWGFANVTLPGTPTIKVITINQSSGEMYIGYDTTGTATSEALTTVTHSGTGKTSPIVKLIGPASGSTRIYTITNYTTGQIIYLNYTILAGELASLDFDPITGSFMSSFQGNIASVILPGSNDADFSLARGSNVIGILASGTVTMNILWNQSFVEAADAVGVI